MSWLLIGVYNQRGCVSSMGKPAQHAYSEIVCYGTPEHNEGKALSVHRAMMPDSRLKTHYVPQPEEKQLLNSY